MPTDAQTDPVLAASTRLIRLHEQGAIPGPTSSGSPG